MENKKIFGIFQKKNFGVSRFFFYKKKINFLSLNFFPMTDQLQTLKKTKTEVSKPQCFYILGPNFIEENDLSNLGEELKENFTIKNHQKHPITEVNMTVLHIRDFTEKSDTTILEKLKTHFPDYEVFDNESYQKSDYFKSVVSKNTITISDIQLDEAEVTTKLLYDLFFLWRKSEKTTKTYGENTDDLQFEYYNQSNLPSYFERVCEMFDTLLTHNLGIFFNGMKIMFVVIEKSHSQEANKAFGLTDSTFVLNVLDGNKLDQIASLLNTLGKGKIYSISTMKKLSDNSNA